MIYCNYFIGGKGNEKIAVFVLSLLVFCQFSLFAKEYTWGTTTRWNNNYPEVVKTMPGVQAALKE